jgi:hypothetical protein
MCSRPTTTNTDHIEHCLWCRQSQGAHRSRPRLARFVSTVATVSVVWSTSTFWRRDEGVAVLLPPLVALHGENSRPHVQNVRGNSSATF